MSENSRDRETSGLKGVAAQGAVRPRYLVGCAGQFMLHEDSGGASALHNASNDPDEAIVMCATLAGAYVIDRLTGGSFGPACWEDIDEARARLQARRSDPSRDGSSDSAEPLTTESSPNQKHPNTSAAPLHRDGA